MSTDRTSTGALCFPARAAAGTSSAAGGGWTVATGFTLKVLERRTGLAGSSLSVPEEEAVEEAVELKLLSRFLTMAGLVTEAASGVFSLPASAAPRWRPGN